MGGRRRQEEGDERRRGIGDIVTSSHNSAGEGLELATIGFCNSVTANRIGLLYNTATVGGGVTQPRELTTIFADVGSGAIGAGFCRGRFRERFGCWFSRQSGALREGQQNVRDEGPLVAVFLDVNVLAGTQQ